MNATEFRHHDIITPKQRMKRESALAKLIKAIRKQLHPWFLDDIALTIGLIIVCIAAFGGISAL